MKVAIIGCAHGKLENIYDAVQFLENENNIKIDLLLCCGDFQATRNLDDLNCMAVPAKYREMCTFYKYYSGVKLAPVLTIFIGGNHEASNYLQELPYGGWVAPNIYYLGYAGVVDYGGIRIAGLSGIFKEGDYFKGRYERPPYNDESLRSCYHIRNLDVFRLKQLSQSVQIMLSHDWPSGIHNYGDLEWLLRNKPYFKEDIENDSLGSIPTAELLYHMKPDYWFAAHLHVKYAAIVEHKNDNETKTTKFLSLDKCLPKRKFLQVFEIQQESSKEPELCYDLEWLTILHLTNHLISTKKINCYMPGKTSTSNERLSFTPTNEELTMVKEKFHNNLKIPRNFVATAPSYNPNSQTRSEKRLLTVINPQTVEFCEKLGIDDPISLILNDEGLNNSNVNLNSTFDASSFITTTDSENDTSYSSLNMSSPFVKRKESFKTPLKLPTPLNSYSISSDDYLTSTPYKNETSEDDIQKSTPTSSSETAAKDKFLLSETTFDDSADFRPKENKFRRRNFALYASNDSE